MEAWNYRILIAAFALCLIVGSTVGDKDERYANFFTQKLTNNLREQYNSHLLRLRRDATQSTSSVRNGMRFKVGVCQLDDFLIAAKNCSKVFYTAARAKGSSRSQCGTDYRQLRMCMLNTLTGCIEDSTMATYLNTADVKEITENFLVFLGNEQFWCDEGGLGISSDYLPAGSMCEPVFYQLSKGCTAMYSRLFNSTASDDKLCSAYQRAKKCYLQTIFAHCTFSRMLRRILEIMIEITADFQPFCKTTAAQERLKLEDLFLDKKCPPYSLADVAFAMDVTNGTDRWQYVVMKRIIEGVAKKMDYGWRGVQASVFHFDTHLRTILKFGRAQTKDTIHRYVRRMSRTATKARNKSKRMTGRSLSALARSTFSPNKNGDTLKKKPWKSGQRLHNAAVVFVLTTGQSKDSMVHGLEMLKDRNVHVVFLGPSHLRVPTTSNEMVDVRSPVEGTDNSSSFPGSGTSRVIETNFRMKEVSSVVKNMIEEICEADRWKQLRDGEKFSEGRVEESKWNSIQGLLSRFGEYDLSLLFELKPIIPTHPRPTITEPKTTSSSVDPSVTEEGMDGDFYFGQPQQQSIEETRIWPFYMGEHEYIQEAPY